MHGVNLLRVLCRPLDEQLYLFASGVSFVYSTSSILPSRTHVSPSCSLSCHKIIKRYRDLQGFLSSLNVTPPPCSPFAPDRDKTSVTRLLRYTLVVRSLIANGRFRQPAINLELPLCRRVPFSGERKHGVKASSKRVLRKWGAGFRPRHRLPSLQN